MKSNIAIKKIMAIKILRKPGVFAIALLVSNFFFVINAIGQDAVGDYRSNATNFNWTTVASWQICTAAGNPGTFITSTTYPGQNVGTPTVTIRTANTVTLNVSPANSIGTLVIIGSFNGSTFTLPISGSWTNNGTFTASTSTINMTGSNAANIGGTATTTFNILTINKNSSGTTVTSASGAKAFTTSFLTITQGNLVLQAIDANYTVSNDLTVSANGTLTHSVSWDTNGKQLTVGGNIVIDGIFAFTVRSHVQMNGSGTKTVRTGSNASSAFSILTLLNGTFNANGILHVKDNFWAMFGSTGSFHTNGQTVTADAGVLVNNGTVFIDGGTLNVTAGVLVGAGTNGAVNISSGILNTDAFNVGNGTQTGAITQSGGTCNISGSLLINSSCSYTCTNSPSINIGGNFTNNGIYTKATETVTLNGTAQTIGGSATTVFNNLSLSGTGTKTFGAARTIGGNLSIISGVMADLGTFSSSANTLTLGGSGALNGSWGSSGSPATHKNDTYFTLGTGIININASTCTAPTAYAVTGGGSFCPGSSGVAVGLANSQSGVNYQLFASAVADGAPVAGTGAAISFGNKTVAASYTVVATNATTACTQNMTGSVTVTAYTVPVTSVANSTNVSCNGAGDGTITVTASGGTSPYMFSVDNGANYQAATGTDLSLFTGLLPNTPYRIKVKDANGCISK